MSENKDRDFLLELKEWHAVVSIETWVDRKGWEKITAKKAASLFGKYNGWERRIEEVEQ